MHVLACSLTTIKKSIFHLAQEPGNENLKMTKKDIKDLELKKAFDLSMEDLQETKNRLTVCQQEVEELNNKMKHSKLLYGAELDRSYSLLEAEIERER